MCQFVARLQGIHQRCSTIYCFSRLIFQRINASNFLIGDLDYLEMQILFLLVVDFQRRVLPGVGFFKNKEDLHGQKAYGRLTHNL